MPEPRNNKNKGTKLLRKLSIIEKDIIKYIGTIREIY